MSTSSSFSKTLMFGAIALTCGALYSAPASAVTRSFYQNSGGTCHGVNAINESKLTREAQRIYNNTNSSVDIVCNLPSDVWATSSGGGVVTYVAIWARPITGYSGVMSCTLNEGFYGQSGSSIYQPVGGNPKNLAANGGAQTIFEWDPAPGYLNVGRYFYGPVNIRCTMPPRSELDDWYVEYDH